MAAEEGASSSNRSCFTCGQNLASNFCICDPSQQVLCDKCIPIHRGKVPGEQHSLLPIRYYEDYKKPHFREIIKRLSNMEKIWEDRVSAILKSKDHFLANSEEFQRKYRLLIERMMTSYDVLYQAVKDEVDSGIEEIKAHLQEPAYIFTNPVAREFWNQDNLTLFETISDISVEFEAMEKQLNDTKVVLEVRCPNLIEEFKSDLFVLLRGRSEAHEYRRNMEEYGKVEDYEQFQAMRSSQIDENRDIERFASKNSLSRCVEKHDVIPKGKLRAKANRVHIFLAALATIIAVLGCLWGWPAVNDTDLVYPNSTSKAKLIELGPYNGGQLSTWPITTGPVYTTDSGDYKGQWEPKDEGNAVLKSHISGYGTMAYRNGDIYEGYWKEGLRHGNGRLITALGDVNVGIWVKNVLIDCDNCIFANKTRSSDQCGEGKLQELEQVQKISGFDSEIMEGLSCQCEKISTSSSENRANNTVIGPGLTYNDSDIFLKKDITVPVQIYENNSTSEYRLRRNSIRTIIDDISSSGIQVETVSFSIDKPIFLTAVGIGNSNYPLQMLKILKGSSTSDPLLYQHGAHIEHASFPALSSMKIALDRSVALQANTSYTLLVKYKAGASVYYFLYDGECISEGGVKFTFPRSSYSLSGKDSADKGPLEDLYFRLQT